MQAARDQDLLGRVIGSLRADHLVGVGTVEEVPGLKRFGQRLHLLRGGVDRHFRLGGASELPLAEQHEDPGNDDREDETCDPSGFKGCFPHVLTVLRPAVEQLNARGRRGPVQRQDPAGMGAVAQASVVEKHQAGIDELRDHFGVVSTAQRFAERLLGE